MALKSFFSAINPFGKRRKEYQYAKMLNGSIPVFTSFGKDVYVSDVVQSAVNRVATEISKLQPRHVRVEEDGSTAQPRSDFNRLLEFGPNPLMTTSEFLEKVVWLLYRNYNCFIYPAYDVVVDNRGRLHRKYTGFYPLDPSLVTFLQDETGNIFVELSFLGGEKFTVPYDDIIHLRKKFSTNDLLGGGRDGRPDNESLLRVLQVEHSVMEGLEKVIPTSMSVRGILKINTLMDDEKQEAERKRFEEAIARGKSGVLPMDLKGDYIPLDVNPKVIDKDTMAFLQEKILNWVGVPLRILTGDFTGDEYQVWYEQELEPLIIRMGQSFSRVLFTENELNHGNKIVFYNRDLMYMSMKAKLELIKTAGEQGLLTDDQKLRILGYPPLPDGTGSRRTISLNFVSVDIVDEYQMKKAGALKDWLGNKEDDGKDQEKNEDE